MIAVESACTACHTPLLLDLENALETEITCPGCGAVQFQQIYSAYACGPRSDDVAPLVDGNTACFFHETSPAAHICDDCGRYLCALCTLAVPTPANSPPDFPARLCPECFRRRVDREPAEGQWDLFQPEYIRYDLLALLLVIGPVVIFPFYLLTILSGPMAVYVAIRYWRVCRTPVGRPRAGLILALILGFIEMMFWGLAFIGFAVQLAAL